MSAQNNALSYTFGYDDLHRLTSKTDTRLGRTLSLEYDPVGNVSRKTDYQGDVTEFQHDSTNRVVAMRNAGYLQASYHYDPAGRLLNRILSSGAQTDYAYDAASRLTRLTQRTADGTQVRSVLYTHDRVGNVLTTVDDEGSSTFGYDALYRLTSADYPGTGDDESFTYDPVGNRITSTRAGSSGAYAHDADNRLQTVRAGLDPDSGPLLLDLDYDADGNETLRRDGAGATIHSLVYDLKNRLTSATAGGQTTDFAYDTGDFRIEEDGPSGRFLSLLEGEHLEAVYDGFGVLKRKYLRGAVIDEVINGYHFDPVGTPTNYTYHHDALQSVVGLSGHAGAIEETLRYRPFGEVRSQTGTSPSVLRFTGRELDAATGLYYYRARYYDPELGRFLTEDPLGFGGGDVNLYAYAGSNPVNANDPLGLDDFFASFSLSLVSPLLRPPGVPATQLQPATQFGLFFGTGSTPGRGFEAGIFHSNSLGLGDDAGISFNFGKVEKIDRPSNQVNSGFLGIGIANLLSETINLDPRTGRIVGGSVNVGIGPTLCGCSVAEPLGPSFNLPEKIDFVAPVMRFFENLGSSLSPQLASPRVQAPAAFGFAMYPSQAKVNPGLSAYSK